MYKIFIISYFIIKKQSAGFSCEIILAVEVGTGAWYYYYFIFLRLNNHNICLKFMIIFREKQVGQYYNA